MCRSMAPVGGYTFPSASVSPTPASSSPAVRSACIAATPSLQTPGGGQAEAEREGVSRNRDHAFTGVVPLSVLTFWGGLAVRLRVPFVIRSMCVALSRNASR
jgi:hypothetical protein